MCFAPTYVRRVNNIMFRKIDRNRKYKAIGDCTVRALQYALGITYEEAAKIAWPQILQAPASDPNARWCAGGVPWPEFVRRCEAAFPGAKETKVRHESVRDFAAKTQGPCIAATVHVENGNICGHCVAVKGGDWFDVSPNSGEYSVVRVLTF